MAAVAVDEDALAVVISGRVKQHAEAIALEVLRQVSQAQTVLQREVRADLPAILSVELVVVVTEVVFRAVGALGKLNWTSDEQVAVVVASGVRLAPLRDGDVGVVVRLLLLVRLFDERAEPHGV